MNQPEILFILGSIVSLITVTWIIVVLVKYLLMLEPATIDLCRLQVGETFIFKDEPRTVFVVLCQEYSSKVRQIHALNCKTGKIEVCDCFAQVYRVSAKFRTRYKLTQPKKPVYHTPVFAA